MHCTPQECGSFFLLGHTCAVAWVLSLPVHAILALLGHDGKRTQTLVLEKHKH